MVDPDKGKINDLGHRVGDKAWRKIKAKREGHRIVLSGLGMFGLIGWSIVVPMLAGAAMGLWLDRRYPQPFS